MGFVIKKGLWDDTGFLNLNVSSGASTTLLTNLVSYWSLNAQTTIPSGTYAGQYAYADSVTATNNPLFDAGDPQDTFGGFGNSVFHSTGGILGGYVEVENDNANNSAPLVGNSKISFNNQGSYSFSLWCKRDVLNNGLQGWALGIGSSSAPDASSFGININGTPKVVIYPSGNTGTSQTLSGNVTISNWNHIVVSVSSGVMTAYLNGSANGAFTIFTLRTGSNFISLGPNVFNSLGNFIGAVDEIGYWSRALTSTEVASLYNNGNGIPYSSFGSTP